MNASTRSADLSGPPSAISNLNYSSWIKILGLKIFYFLCILLALGTPILSLWKLCFLLGATLILITGTIRLQASRILYTVLTVILLISTKSFLPAPEIEEGNNLFLPVDGLRTKTPDILPPLISSFLTDVFYKQYPPENWCSPKTNYCWRNPHVAPTIEGFAFSSDSAFHKPKYSRRVDSIEFHDVASFRGGFVNRLSLNWADKKSDMKRDDMPYFVMYELPPGLTGSSLCWKGDVLWEKDSQDFKHILHESMECQELSANNTGKKVFGVSIWVESPLAMKLELSPPLQISFIIKTILSIISVIGILALTVRVRFNALFAPVVIILLTIVAIPGDTLVGFEDYQAYEGSNDGLTHESYAHSILIPLLNGDFKEAVRGGEDVFFFTPGLRYFKVPARMVFGDTQLGELIPLLLLPLAVFCLLRVVFPVFGASFLLFTFIFVTSFHRLHNGWTLRGYSIYAVEGFAEVLGYGFFLFGMALLVKYRTDKTEKFYQAGFWANLLFALAIFVRPNLVVASALVLCYNAWSLIRDERVKDFLFISCGFSPFFLMFLHNLVYGDVYALMLSYSGSSSITNFSDAVRLTRGVTPGGYLEAFKAAVLNMPDNEMLQKVTIHLARWVEDRWWRAYFFLLCFLPLIPFKWVSFPLRSLSLAALGLHAMLFLTQPDGRMALLAWMINSIIGFAIITRFFSFAAGKLAKFKEIKS